MTGNAQPKYNGDGIELHGEDGFKGMRKAGALAAEVLDFITPHVQPGVTTEELDTLCHDYITKIHTACVAVPAIDNHGDIDIHDIAIA